MPQERPYSVYVPRYNFHISPNVLLIYEKNIKKFKKIYGNMIFFMPLVSINNIGENFMFAFKLILFSLFVMSLSFIDAYSATATDNPNDRCPDKRCCLPLKGNEYPL